MMEHTYIGDPKFGIYLYHNAIPRELNVPERLESAIGDSTHQLFSWRDAVVGYNQKMPEYRDCVDLKMSPLHWQYLEPQYEEVKACYEDTEKHIKDSLVHYQSMFNISMEYMEAINFVRYTPGQHFQIHTDHGFSYTCTVSSIAYLNDDYEGGELWFPYLDLTYKPAAGDILLFPSTYIYAHAALKVHSGTKYAAVTMFDYNDNNHRYPQGRANDGSAADPSAGVAKTPGRQFTYPEN
jgi:hypothetical protein